MNDEESKTYFDESKRRALLKEMMSEPHSAGLITEGISRAYNELLTEVVLLLPNHRVPAARHTKADYLAKAEVIVLKARALQTLIKGAYR